MTPKPSPRPSILPMLRKRRWQVHPVLLVATAAAALVNPRRGKGVGMGANAAE